MRRLKTLFFLIAIAVFSACAQQKSGYSLKFEVSQRDFADTITIDVVGGRVVVPVMLDGRLFRFMLDTGAAQAVIYSDTPIDGTESAGAVDSYDAVGHRHKVPMVVLPPFSIGHTTFTGCRATVHKRPHQGTLFDGIVGFDIICKGLQMKIDIAARHLVITDRKNHFAREEGFEAKYHVAPYYHTPYLHVEPFRGFQEEVLFDTGSNNIYVLSRKSFERAELEHIPFGPQLEGKARASYAVGLHGREDSLEVAFLCIDSLKWAGFTFCQLETKTTQGYSHLGAGLLQYGSVTFLPRKKRVRFQPYVNQSYVDVCNQQIEKVVESRSGRPTVTFVWPKGKAFAAGLRVGDVLLKADERPLPFYEDYARYHYLIGRTYTFSVEDRFGFCKEVKMTW